MSSFSLHPHVVFVLLPRTASTNSSGLIQGCPSPATAPYSSNSYNRPSPSTRGGDHPKAACFTCAQLPWELSFRRWDKHASVEATRVSALWEQLRGGDRRGETDLIVLTSLLPRPHPHPNPTANPCYAPFTNTRTRAHVNPAELV